MPQATMCMVGCKKRNIKLRSTASQAVILNCRSQNEHHGTSAVLVFSWHHAIVIMISRSVFSVGYSPQRQMRILYILIHSIFFAISSIKYYWQKQKMSVSAGNIAMDTVSYMFLNNVGLVFFVYTNLCFQHTHALSSPSDIIENSINVLAKWSKIVAILS